MMLMAVLFIVTVVSFLLFIHISQTSTDVYKRVLKTFPGPTPVPIFGNSHIFGSAEDPLHIMETSLWYVQDKTNFPVHYKPVVQRSGEELADKLSFKVIQSLSKQYERFFRIFIGGTVFVVLHNYRDFEKALGTTHRLEKNRIYHFLEPWLGTGLLTSAGAKWKSRRKIITPGFHFTVLSSHIHIFNANGVLLCEKLAEKVGKGTFDVLPIIKLYALDNIFETAMKSKINALTNSESTYVRAVRDIATMITLRSFNVLLFNDILFNLSKYGRIHRNALKVLHETTKKVIRERRKELADEKTRQEPEEANDDMYSKKRMAFLDILLSSKAGYELSDEDICEEVNTFMFEGHDTVSSGISFALYALAHHPKIQKIAYEEQLSIFGDDDRHPTDSDIQKMQYLDMVLKESQRVYPSVPFIGRYVHEDIELSGGYILPKGCQITLLITQLHRDPEVWPDPDTFNPDNFLPDAVAQRSPYAYVPFSAGERNCIGQRFALLEMKSCLSKVLRRFKILPSPNREDDVKPYAELVLVSSNGVRIQIEERNSKNK